MLRIKTMAYFSKRDSDRQHRHRQTDGQTEGQRHRERYTLTHSARQARSVSEEQGGQSLPFFFFLLTLALTLTLSPPRSLARARSCLCYGLRAKIKLRCLLKCLAYRNGKKTVTDAEFREFLELADFINLNLNPI